MKPQSIQKPVNPSEPVITEESVLKQFSSFLEEYQQFSVSKREALHKALIQSVYVNFKFNKVVLIQKVVQMLLSEGGESSTTLKKVVTYYQDVAGFKIYIVGKDVQVKRLKVEPFTYATDHLNTCKSEDNRYWNLSQGKAAAPYTPKNLDTVKKTFAANAALAVLTEDCTQEDVEKLISELKSALVTALKNPKVIAKAELAKAQKNAAPETYDID